MATQQIKTLSEEEQKKKHEREVRKNALRKLTDEERRILGI